MFDRELFNDPKDLWPSLIDTLRLASAILECPASTVFLYTLMYEPRKKLVEDSIRLSAELYNVWYPKRQMADMKRGVAAKMKKLEEQIQFEWFDEISAEGKDYCPVAYTSGNMEQVSLINLGPAGWDSGLASITHLPYTIGLAIQAEREKLKNMNRSYVTSPIARTNKTYARSLSVLLRLQFRLAVVICHEVVHAVDIGTNPPGLRSSPEPFLCDHRLNELGCAYENCLFGGVMEHVSEDNWQQPQRFTRWPSLDGPDSSCQVYERRLPGRLATSYFVSMRFISDVQQQDFWNRPVSIRGTVMLQIPKTIGFRVTPPKGNSELESGTEYTSELQISPNLQGRVFL